MRKFVFLCASLSVSSLSIFAADLKVKVVDPQHAAVAGAWVQVLASDSARVLAQSQTNSEGYAELRGVDSSARVQVLAPGFAAAMQHVAGSEPVIQLAVAASPETVVVTATGIPTVSDETGSQTETLNAQQIRNMNPVSLGDALQFLPGAIVSNVGQRGGQTSLFVRGGDSDYNKVIVDGVPINEPGGFFDFGVVPMQQIDRVEFTRGPESALYGTDAMTSTIQMFSATGSTRTPELRFGADGGNFGTGHGYASVAGAYGKFDYNLFGDQFNTSGHGPNDDYSNSSEGANLGYAITPDVGLRFRVRDSNNRSGVQNEYDFNGAQLLPPDLYQHARQNNFLSSLALNFKTPGHWQHQVSGYEYHHKRANVQTQSQADRVTPFGLADYPFSSYADLNRAGFNYQGEWTPLAWTHSTVGYSFEDENGFFGDPTLVAQNLPLTHGLRRNHTIFGEQFVTWKRFTVLTGVNYVNNEYFGARVLPRATATFRAFSGTRLRVAYGQGIKEPSFEQTFGIGGNFPVTPNPNLQPEQSRSIEGGITQSLFNQKLVLSGTYYHQNFTNQVAFEFNPLTFASQYVNLNRTLAHGAEFEAHGRINDRTSLQASYYYTSTQILSAPLSFDPMQQAGAPLLRRPKHAGTLLVNYNGNKWGGNVGGSFIGRRPDEDFYGFNLNHAAGYALVNLGGWHTVNRFTTAYINIENALNKSYNQALGYPGLPINFRAGLRFKLGGE
jgi:vitamin B12 transporter